MLAGGFGANPLELNVTEYRISEILKRWIEAVRQVQLLVQVVLLKSSFWYVRLGDTPTPAEFHYAIAKSGDFLSGFLKKYYSTIA
ncbi:hypothetical protein AT270_10280 [Bacillus cereus]|nr:hypothetical protein AT270_10280 [Bacillus cereus]